MNIKIQCEDIKSYIVEGLLEKAITALMDLGQDIDFAGSNIGRRALALSFKFNKLKSDNLKGILYFEAYQIESNKIVNEIIELISEIIQFENRSESTQKSTFFDADKKTYEQEREKYFKNIEENRKEKLNYDTVCIAESIFKTYRSNSSFMLKNINLQLKLGEITCVIGKNAAGKSTILNIIAGKLAPSNGSIFYPHISLTKNKWNSINNSIAFVPQRIEKWSGKLKENLHLYAAIKGVRGKENLYQVDWIMERMGLSDYKHAKWFEISGGLQLRFELAKMLVWKPKLVVLDEPIANLDLDTQFRVLSDIKELSKSHKNSFAAVISSQQIFEIERVCDKLLFVENGNVLFNDTFLNIKDKFSGKQFELEIDSSKNDIVNIVTLLEAKNIFHVIVEGNKLILQTKDYISSNALLKQILAENISILYFRDTTNSASRFFYNN